MAGISGAADAISSTTIPSSSIPVGENLNKNNYLLWKAQVLPAIKATQLEGFLTGEEKEPAKYIEEKGDASVVRSPNPAYTKVGCSRSIHPRISPLLPH